MLEGECEARREVNEARDGTRHGKWGQGSLRAHPGSMHPLCAAARARPPRGADAPAAVAGEMLERRESEVRGSKKGMLTPLRRSGLP